MNRFFTASALVALAALTAAPALAATAAPAANPAATAKPAATTKMATTSTMAAKPKAVTFKSLDTNKDGEVSLAELQKVWPQITKAEFDKFAKKKPGMLDRAELAALVKSLQPAKAAAAK